MRFLVKQVHPLTKTRLNRPYAVKAHALRGQGKDGILGRHDLAAGAVSTGFSAETVYMPSDEVCRPCGSMWDNDALCGLGRRLRKDPPCGRALRRALS